MYIEQEWSLDKLSVPNHYAYNPRFVPRDIDPGEFDTRGRLAWFAPVDMGISTPNLHHFSITEDCTSTAYRVTWDAGTGVHIPLTLIPVLPERFFRS